MRLTTRRTHAVVAVAITVVTLAPTAKAATTSQTVRTTLASASGTGIRRSFATATTTAATAATRTVGVGDWPAIGASSAADFDNVSETAVTAANVTSLGRKWAVPSLYRDIKPVLVAGGLVISEAAVSTTDKSVSLVALDPATGRVVWSRPDVGAAFGMIADGSTLFLETSGTVKGQRKALLGVAALDLATGADKWFTADLSPDALYGYANMAVDNGTVYAGFLDGIVVALRESDGKPLWQNNGGFVNGVTAGGSWVFAQRAENRQFVALDAKTGRTVWAGNVSPLPQVISGEIVSGTGTTQLAVYRLAGCGTYPQSDCEPAWQRTVTGPISSITGSAGLIVVGVNGSGDSSTVQAFDATTGALKWSASAPGRNTLSTAGGLIYAAYGDGTNPVVVRAFRSAGCATAPCAPVWEYHFPEWSSGQFAGPVVVSHGQLYLSLGEGGLQAFAPNTGVPSFEADANGASGTTAVSWGTGRIDLFGVDTSGALQHRYWRSGAGWSRWQSLGGSGLASTPAAASWAVRRLDVVVRTTSGAIVHKYFDGANWSGFEQLATGALGNPTVASVGLRRLDIFYTVGRQDGPVSATQVSFNRGWQDPVAVPGQVYRALSAVSSAPGRLDLFGMTAGDGMERTSLVSGAWQPWQPVRVGGLTVGPYDSSDLSVIATGPGRFDAFFLGENGVSNAMVHIFYANGSWQQADSLPSIDYAGPSAVSMAPGRIDVFGVGSDYALQQLYYTNGKWHASTP